MSHYVLHYAVTMILNAGVCHDSTYNNNECSSYKSYLLHVQYAGFGLGYKTIHCKCLCSPALSH